MNDQLPDTEGYQRLNHIWIIRWLISRLAKWGVEPNFITLSGVLFGAGAVGFLWLEFWFGALCMLLLSGLCDFIDGPVAKVLGAKRNNRSANIGQLLDWYVDRVADIILLMGAMLFAHPNLAHQGMIMGAAFCHLMSSSVRLKATELGRSVVESRPITRTAFYIIFGAFFLAELLAGLIADRQFICETQFFPIFVWIITIWMGLVLFFRSIKAFNSD